MKNWKTTVAGIVTGVAALIASNPDSFVKWPWMVTVAQIITAGGLASLGLAAKDSNVTGGTKLNTPPASDAEELKASASRAEQKS